MSKKNRVTSLDFGIWLCIVGGTESVRGFPTDHKQISTNLGLGVHKVHLKHYFFIFFYIFTSSALKTWVLHVNTFYSWILLYISPVTAVNISILLLIYFSFTNISMFLYARIYWLEEFGDISCLQFNLDTIT